MIQRGERSPAGTSTPFEVPASHERRGAIRDRLTSTR